MKTYYVVRCSHDDSTISWGINVTQYIVGIFEDQREAQRLCEHLEENKLRWCVQHLSQYFDEEELADVTFSVVRVDPGEPVAFGGAFYIE